MSLDDMILKTMKKNGKNKAMSVSMISLLTGASPRHVRMKLHKLQKYGKIKRHKSMKVSFWRLNE